MAELLQRERLQPSLLDRLTDDAPSSRQESRSERVLSIQRLRQCVLRDLAWLLNSHSLLDEDDIRNWPEVAKSVVNFGMPHFGGRTASSVDVNELTSRLREVIWHFEPRIIRETLKVSATLDDNRMDNKTLSFQIEGDMWAQPIPLHLYMKTEVDLETGHVVTSESLR